MELRDYIHVIRARKWVIIQSVVIVTLAALVFSLLQPPSYRGTAEVLISEKDAASAILGNVLQLSNQPERALQTQIQLIRLRPIAEQTIKKLNLQTTPQELLKHVTVTAAAQTDLIEITASNADPETAAKIANTIAQLYVLSARDAQRESITAAADEVQKRLDAAKSEVIDLGHKLAASGSSTDLQAELQIATGTYSTLAEKLEQLRINEQLETGPGRVAALAVADSKPVEPQPLRDTALGLLVGLVFGVGVAFLLEYLDNTLKSTEEAEKIFGAPVLGTIPLEKLEKGEKRRLAIVQAPGSSTAEAYRVVRNSLDFINFQNDMKTVLVTSAAPGEGKSTVASNLAAALAQAGKRVVLVSVDFRRPTTDQFFTVNNQIGLSDVLLGTYALKAALQRPGDDQLLVLTSGKMPPNPSELLGSDKMREVLEALGEWGEWVIIDAPPLLAVADPASVARWADGVLMVTQAGVSTREATRKAVELLGKVGARIIGVVVWGLDEARAESGRYGYYAGGYYYYSSYYSDPVSPSRKHKTPKKNTQSGAAPAAVEAEPWVPEPSGRQRFASVVGKILTATLAFLAVLVLAGVVAYILDLYFGWGLSSQAVIWLRSVGL